MSLFDPPDAVSLTKIRAHEEQLGQACEYDKHNLYYTWVFLEDSIEVNLQQRIVTTLREFDSGPALWNILQKTLQGAATSKMIRVQKIINEIKLTDVLGLDVGEFHEMVKHVFYACNKQGNFPWILVLGSSRIILVPRTLRLML